MNHPYTPGLSPTAGRAVSVAEAGALIATGRPLSLAADEALLRALPKGNWIGGTSPYFMGQDGGETTRERIFVTELPAPAGPLDLRFYDVFSLDQVCVDAPANGFSLIILPAFSGTHSLFARNAPNFDDMYVKPLVGWVAGVHLDDLGRCAPAVVNGRSGEFDSERAVVMHVPLPDEQFVRVDIVNPLRPGRGDCIRFAETGFSASECLVNGRPARLAEYLQSQGSDLRLPLVADYSGALVNVSIKGISPESGSVDFYAPVFPDVDYRLAEPPGDYVAAFQAAMPAEGFHAAFSCNCILNYLYGGLEGRHTGPVTGPVTFGEIAYQLLNQTMVYMTIER